MSDKPIKAKPHFYAVCGAALQEIAREMGYNLVIHGSMNRDLDLIAIPWVDNPKSHLELLQELDKYLRGVCMSDLNGYNFTMLPGGRSSYVINIFRGARFNDYLDLKYYIDISITPLLNKAE